MGVLRTMTNTYKDNAPIDEKAKEELRLIRCLAERLLRCMNESLFVDYQMEKFGDKFKGDTHDSSSTKSEPQFSLDRILSELDYVLSYALKDDISEEERKMSKKLMKSFLSIKSRNKKFDIQDTKSEPKCDKCGDWGYITIEKVKKGITELEREDCPKCRQDRQSEHHCKNCGHFAWKHKYGEKRCGAFLIEPKRKCKCEKFLEQDRGEK